MIIGTGGPASSDLARMLIDAGEVNSSFSRLQLEYKQRVITSEQFVRLRSGSQGGVILAKHGKELLHNGTVMYSDEDHINSDGMLERDVLLVSRLPSYVGQIDVLLFSGFHGPATQAAELIFQKGVFNDQQFAKVRELLTYARYWQMVLEVYSLSHDGMMTQASGICLSRSCEPRELSFLQHAE
jgi:hypothetical protein